MSGDLRHALRSLRRAPGFAAVAVLTLALGIGVNTSLFTLVDALFLQPLPVESARELVMVMQRGDLVNVPYGHSYPDYLDVRGATAALIDLAAFMPTPVHLSAAGQTPERTWIEVVSPNYFELARVQPALGRLLRAGEGEAKGAAPTIVLSHRYWQRRFGGDASVVGRMISLNGRGFTVIGVAPPSFTGLAWAMAVSGFVPSGAVGALLEGGDGFLTNRGAHAFRMMGRLAPGKTLAEARAEMDLVAGRVYAAHPAAHKGSRVVVAPENRSRPDAGPVLAGFVPAGDIPVNTDHPWDWRVYVFTFVVSAAAGVAAGLWPALESSRVDLAGTLKEGGGPRSGFARHPVLNLLVIGQVTLSVVVLSCAALFWHSLSRMQGMALGFRTGNILMVSLDLGLQQYGDERGRRFLDQLLERTAALPGVRSATLTQHVPFDYGMQVSEVATEGDIPGAKDGYVSSALTVVGPRFFETTGTPVRRGRGLEPSDDERSPRVAVINETMARTLWPGADAIGKRFRSGRGGEWTTVVGVAGDGKYVMLAETPRSYFYLPLAQNYRSPITLMVHSAGEPSSLSRPVQEVLRQMDPDLPVFNVRTLDRHIRESVFGLMPLRMAATMAAVEGLLGLLLAVLGLYSVVSYAASRRVHEIGVRMALGARPGDVLRLVVRGGMRLALAGVAMGVVLAAGAGFALSHVLYGVERVATGVLAPVALLLLAVAALACYLPARRATRVDPVVALRCE